MKRENPPARRNGCTQRRHLCYPPLVGSFGSFDCHWGWGLVSLLDLQDGVTTILLIFFRGRIAALLMEWRKEGVGWWWWCLSLCLARSLTWRFFLRRLFRFASTMRCASLLALRESNTPPLHSRRAPCRHTDTHRHTTHTQSEREDLSRSYLQTPNPRPHPHIHLSSPTLMIWSTTCGVIWSFLIFASTLPAARVLKSSGRASGSTASYRQNRGSWCDQLHTKSTIADDVIEPDGCTRHRWGLYVALVVS